LTDQIETVRRSITGALFHAMPAIALMTLILWAFALSAALSVAFLIDLEVIGATLCVLVFAAPAIWANWHVVRLSVEAERVAA
jgi:hypothetical protein